MGFTDHLRSIGCCVSVVGLRLVIRWCNLLESVVREFIVIFVNWLTRVPLATTDDNYIIVACRRVWRVIGVCKQTKGGLLPGWQCRLWWRWGGFQLDVGDTFGTNEAISTFNIVIKPSEHTEHDYSCCF